MVTNPLLSQDRTPQDTGAISLRPKTLNNFIGQEHIKKNLSVFIRAAESRREPLDHTLLYGPPGLGKTTLAQIIAIEMGGNFKSTAGPILSKPTDLAGILTSLKQNDVLFVDEIHRLSIALEEILYAAMEDFVIDILIGEGVSARSVKIHLPKFTLVGATTRLGLLSNPLRDRFGIPLRLEFYSPSELATVILQAATLLKVGITETAAHEIGARARGTPRIALRLLKRIRDFAVEAPEISLTLAANALDHLQVDKLGLDSNDYRYLKFIAESYQGGPVGLETIAAALAEKRDSIEDIIEPYLLQIGFIQRTPRGRLLTPQALFYIQEKL